MTAKKASKTEARNRLVLLDSHAIIHRAYHALPDFSSSKGEPTGALYGLITMLLKIADDLKPDYLVAARDLPGPTHRHELFEDYKATRVKAEDELIAQLERAPKVFEAFGIPLYQAAGYEADDIIGTVVKQVAKEKTIETIIASGDLDTLQLVNGGVRVYTMRKGMNDTVMYDKLAVYERFHFGPEQMTDYKALRGDPSDNIPGIKGIGEKTATELLIEFGSLKESYTALEKHPKEFAKKMSKALPAGRQARIVELLRVEKEQAYFSKQLATIHRDAPITFTLPDHPWRLADHDETIFALCDELEFRSLRERVRGAINKTRPADKEIAATHAQDVDEKALREVSIAVWLLRSDITNPSLEDILNFAHTEDFEKAREVVFKQLRETGRLREVFETIERPLIPIVQHMNETGIALDTAYLKKLSLEYNRELGKIAGRIFKHAGHEFNINSPRQLAAVLFDELKITPVRQKMTATGARTTKEAELAKLSSAHPIIADTLAYRELQKLLSTYVEKMPKEVHEDGRLHAQFIQAGTTTGRMASQDPNLQNIPIKSEYGRRIREAFVAGKGKLLAALDYSQIELRIAAGLSGDTKLIRVFREGGDIHAAVAAEVFAVPPEMVDYEMRRRAKVINFGILYGMGVNALRANLSEGLPAQAEVSRDEAARFLSEYFKRFSGLARYIEHTKAAAVRTGYTETLFGRRRYFPALQSALPNLRAQAERMAINAPMQGTQSDIIKLAMVEADAMIENKGWREKAKLVLQVHDELVYELGAKEAETIARDIRAIMESVVPAKELSGVPVVAEVAIGKNWGALKKIGREER